MTQLSSVGPGFDFLNSLGQWTGNVAGELRPPFGLFKALGNPQDAIKTIHIAGTNGKGSVVSFMGAMLGADGMRVGQFFSPHLSSVCERCVVDGLPVSADEFDAALLEVKRACEQREIEASYFEATCAASFLCFAKRQVDIAVAEVGLGGRFDATNVITKPEVSIITRIALDHTHILGDTLAKVAFEKAGIIKPRVPVVSGPQSEEALEVVRERASELSAPLVEVGADYLVEGGFSMEESLAGVHQRENAAIAAQAAELLGLSKASIQQGIERARWPGRLERVSFGDTELLLDAAHNPLGIEKLLDFIQDMQVAAFVLAFRSSKDWKQMLEQFVRFCSTVQTNPEFVLTEASSFAAPVNELQAELMELLSIHKLDSNVAICGTVQKVPSELKRFSSRGLVVCAGSIYMIGELRPLVTSAAFRTIE